MSDEDKKTKKHRSAMRRMEVLQDVNPKSMEYLTMRKDLIDVNTEIANLVRKKVEDGKITMSDLCRASAALTRTLEFEKGDKFAIIKMIDGMDANKVNLLSDMIAYEGALDEVDNEGKKLDRKVWS